jgi:aryl-alcohol dehydrogenase-like predicted oxidoreductase
MAYRTLGKTALTVSPLCLGGNVFGWTADEQRSFAVLDAYMEGGGNFIDTADAYSTWLPGHVGGESESILGRWMSARNNRGRVILVTKVGSRMGTAPDAYGLSRRHILEEVEASLRRLRTEYIDLYLAHRDDTETPLEETLATFDALVRQGKVRYIGASNYGVAHLREALYISNEHGYARYACLQPPYSLMNRTAYEGELQRVCLEEGLGVMTYSSLASGFLSGMYRQGKALPGSPRAKGIEERYMHEQGFRVLETLDHVATTHSATVSQVALAWIMAQPGITSAIASATSVEQVNELLSAVEVSLRADEIQALNRASTSK